MILINSHKPAGMRLSPASYICQALSVTCTNAAQSVWVRFCAARKVLTASALGKDPAGLRLGWLLINFDFFRVKARSAESEGLSATMNRVGAANFKASVIALAQRKLSIISPGAKHGGVLADDFAAFVVCRQESCNLSDAVVVDEFLSVCSHFLSPAPVPRGAVGSDFAAMRKLYANYVRVLNYFLRVNPKNCNNAEYFLKTKVFNLEAGA